MVREVRIYVEGGGDQRGGKDKIQQGFSQFFRKVVDKNRAKLRVIACGGREQTFKDFKKGLKSNPDAFNILLVDSEAIIDDAHTSWKHLEKRDQWVPPPSVTHEQCHLMVQVMEAWFIADKEALTMYYGNMVKASQ